MSAIFVGCDDSRCDSCVAGVGLPDAWSLGASAAPVATAYPTVDLVSRWLRALDARGAAPKTMRNYCAWGERLCKRWRLIRQEDFPECVEVASASLRRQGYSPTTIHAFQCAMASLAGHVWQWAPDRRKALIVARPVRAAHTVPDVDQVRAFLAVMTQPYHTIALLCYCCGLRISEAVGLQLGDLQLAAGMLTVRASKGAKGRRVPIPPEFVFELRKYAAKAVELCEVDLARGDIYAPQPGREFMRRPSQSREPGQWPLFPQPALTRDHRSGAWVRVFIHASKVERAFKTARTKSGVAPHITPHRLRDAFAVHSLVAGVPVNVIQQAMGHASLETTAKYLSYLLTDEGAKLFPGLNLYSNTQSA